MKRLFYLLLPIFILVLLTSCSSKQETEKLICAEAEMTSFPYSAGGLKVTRHQTVTPVEGVEGLEVIETYFINEGKPVTVKAYELCRTQIRPEEDVVWSFQPSSTAYRLDWVLPVEPGFEKQNYLGMNNTDYGGGIPMVDLWERDGGVAIGLFEPALRMISMPVEWKRYDDEVTMALHYDLPEPMELGTGETLQCFKAFRLKHKGDYFNALRVFSEYMQANENIVLQPSEPEAFEPVWCAWGYERTFTMDEIIGTLDKVSELGFRWVDVDDGYQIAEGDWNTNERFPGGDADMRRITDEIHKRGLKAKLWWAPLAADPGTQILKDHPEMLLRTAGDAPEFITWWDSWYLSPVSKVTDAYTKDLLHMFLQRWNFDGLKIDGQHVNCCMPDYGLSAAVKDPLEAPEQMPSYFAKVYQQAREYKENAVVQICPCGCAVNYFLLPNFNQAVASDPESSLQVRLKRKAYAAMAPGLAYYGDHVELTDGGDDFASQIGTGSVIGSKFTWPEDNPDVTDGPFVLTQEKEALIRKWMKIYKENDLARGEYLNLYTWGFDYPEGHVIRQNDALYYAFYADAYDGRIEIRGLDPDAEYTAVEYTADEPRSFTVKGSDPYIEAFFEKNYLIKVTKND